MVRVLFDTNILIDFLNGAEEARKELALFSDSAISIVSWMEVLVGAQQATVETTRLFLDGFEVVPLDAAIAEHAVELRKQYRLKLPDAVVWASATVQSRLFITRDRKDFPNDAPGVRIPYRL